ncbi:hypothetical protein J6590_084826 [Homalodisca vitripennis]|nr:hypothetical protein J6590_084826 [Homalodisca vitripennis]
MPQHDAFAMVSCGKFEALSMIGTQKVDWTTGSGGFIVDNLPSDETYHNFFFLEGMKNICTKSHEALEDLLLRWTDLRTVRQTEEQVVFQSCSL